MKLKLKIAVLFVLLSAGNAYAHALWIETAATGKAGQKQAVYVYYGEYAENERDSVSHWFSDVKEVKLWLVAPDNKKTLLTTNAEATRLSAEFTPAVNGTYTILADHAVKEVPRTTLYQFVSSATVTVGSVVTPKNAVQNTNSLSLTIPDGAVYKANKPITLNAKFKDKASTDISFTVSSPTGWSKTIKADANGNLVFTPIWPGVYFIEAFYTEKITGEQNGKAYDSVWRGATYLFNVVQ